MMRAVSAARDSGLATMPSHDRLISARPVLAASARPVAFRGMSVLP